MADVNYKPIILNKLEDYGKLTKGFSFMETIYTILRRKNLKQRPTGISLHWLLEIDDRDIITAIENAKEDEIETLKIEADA